MSRVAPADAPSLIAALADIVGQDHVLTGERMLPFANDVYRSLAAPRAVVRPQSVEALQAVVRAAAARGVKLSIRGGGASYTDGYIPREEGMILLDMGGLNRIVSIDEASGYVTVEAGTTWATLRDALAARDLRTPFWGPFSGLVATIGGSMSQNSISHGSGAYGISAESVLSFDVVLADGSMLHTGSAAARGNLPFARHFGPDLTGLFTGDCGAFGIKARVTLPILRRRPAHRPISFAFPDFATMHEAMRRVALERIEDSHFSLDAALSQGQIARQDKAGASLSIALSIMKTSPSLLSGAKQVAQAALSARKQMGAAAFMVHYIVEGLDDAECRARLHRIRTLIAGLGNEIAATVPAVVRGMPFAPLFNTLGPSGERWVPLHGILPHANAAAFHDALVTFYAARKTDMEALGVWTGGMFATLGSSGFLYEIAIYWPDVYTPYHEAAIPADYLAGLPRYPDSPAGRAYVHQLKEDLIALYVAHGAINFQIGKAYPYASRLHPEPLALVAAIKAGLDPDGLLSPGALGLN
jgi:D-lactate dehydrogenase (cytochrome)